MTDIEIAHEIYLLRARAEELGRLWNSHSAEFASDDITAVREAIVALGPIIRESTNQRAAA